MRKKLLFKGPVTTSSGYGVHARQLLRALLLSDQFDVSVIPIKWGETAYIFEDNDLVKRAELLAAKYEREKVANVKYDVSVQVTIPNEFEKLAHVNIGVTAGIEVDHVSPEWLMKCNQVVDAVIVPSKHSLDVFVASKYDGSDGSKLALEKPIALCHEGVDTAIFNTGEVDTSEFDDIIPEFNFIYVGLGLDKAPGEDRKNVSELVKWFCEKFKGDPNVGLVLKTGIVNGSLMDFETTKTRLLSLRQSAGAGDFHSPRIKLIHGRLTDLQLAALYKHPKIKAFVSLTHGEGFGLPLLEAAACGLPVVATDWSGHLDFLVQDGVRKFVSVTHRMGDVPESCVWPGVIEKGTHWAYPDENDAKTKMYKLSKSYETPKRWATELAAHVAEKFSLQVTGERFVDAVNEVLSNVAPSQTDFVSSIRSQVSHEAAGSKTLLYTMPMSAGDVLISTAVVDSLKKKFPDHKVFFATSPKFFPLLQDNPDIHQVIEWQPWMQDISICEKIFDEVYTPNLAIQMVFSNWVHKGKGRLLGDEMANHCQVELGEYKVPLAQTRIPKDRKYVLVHPGAGTGQWEARNYLYWQEVITNLRNMLPDYEIEQLGMEGDPKYKDCTHLFGTSYAEMASVIKDAACLVGIDTVSMHMAAALGTPHVALFGSSYSTSTGPAKSKGLSVLIDTPSRYSCDKACYKHQCLVDKDHPCINEIEPRKIVWETLSCLARVAENTDVLSAMDTYKTYAPKLSGYTHVLNAESQGFPYIESVESMLGFCDEVIVVDGGSTDGTREVLNGLAASDQRLQIVERKWDWNEPGMDGMQKAFGRAMCTGEFLWQQDADEVVSERDYEKIKKLVKRFPKNVDLMHLPVIELWGDEQTCRTDRHSWKWRLSRNNFRITHGIVKQARIVDEKTGLVYAKKGMSDGCEMIDIMTHEYIQHAGFYSNELEMLRHTDPEAYGPKMNEIFEELPSVWHFSWASLERKIKNFRDFWDVQWSRLHNETERQPRFSEAEYADITGTAKMLRERGGEHGQAKTFKLHLQSPLNGKFSCLS